jgi:hypothetical protein
MTKIIISRFELINNPPTGKVVGFTVKNTDNGLSDYVETIIPLAKCVDKTDNDICQYAYSIVKTQIDKINTKLLTSSNVVGSEFIP